MSVTIALPEPLPEHAAHFVVGQDRDGRWVAVGTHGLGGGVFRSRKDALHDAAGETLRRADAVTESPGRIDVRM